MRATVAPRAFRPQPGARALRHWSDADLRAVSAVCAPAWEAWLSDWCTEAESAPAIAQAIHASASGARSREWTAMGERGGGSAWLEGGDDGAARMVRCFLFGEATAVRSPAHGPIAGQVQHAAWTHLRSSLESTLGVRGVPTERQDAEGVFDAWSGAVEIELGLGLQDARIRILLDGDFVDALLGFTATRPPFGTASELVPLQHALSSLAIPLRAVLEPVELDIAAITQLRAGDILPLPHALDTDLALTDADGVVLFSGFLGCAGGRRALQLTPVALASPNQAP